MTSANTEIKVKSVMGRSDKIRKCTTEPSVKNMQNVSNLNIEEQKLIELAKAHAKECFRPGITSMAAVLRTADGKFFTGINIKYKKVWKCICAERVAIAKALEAGETIFDTIVTVKYEDEDDSFTVVNMCGECRQIAIFHKPLKVIVGEGNNLRSLSIREIIPYAYE
ncbi:MAG: Cytidine deaminase [Microgenomates group bacterium GW2011_GWA1_Microgenomates_45_10]|nr:MAG: Cytidine deaminase [Microgenomates group bacterium GW2011_GWA1_Microgenomates_45_10]